MKIAGVQMDVAFADIHANVDRVSHKIREAAANGAALAVFPECALTGYCFTSLAEALPLAQSIPGPATTTLAQVCADTGLFAVVGMLERDGDRIFNAAVLIGPQGVVGTYRKVHLPWLGVDMFTTPGDRPFAIHHAGPIRLGMNICYDSGFPEGSRCLTLQGADLIVLPTNWPAGAEIMSLHGIPCRAMENHVYFAAVDRVGTERGFTFIGNSSICGPSGAVLASAMHPNEDIIYAEIDPAIARAKRIVRVPDKHAIDRLADRRPEMYGEVTQPHSLANPRAVFGTVRS